MPPLRIPAVLVALLLPCAFAPRSLAGTPPPATPPTAPSATPPATPTRQQIYDAAQAAFDKGDWSAAIAGLSSIALPERDGKLSRSQGAIHARLAHAYAQLGETAAAVREVNLALKGLTNVDAVERAQMWLALGNSQRFDLEATEAAASFTKALEDARLANEPALVQSSEIGLAQIYMTLDPGKAKALMDDVLAIEAGAKKDTKDMRERRAQLVDLRGRASLNLGEASEAMPYFREAIKLSGGMTGSRVNLLQISIRGDAALGAFLTHNPDDARKYLAYTGAGHLQSEEWNRGFGDPPVCSEAQDIRADDSVVVEFSIGADGQVIGAAPVYASRPGTLGFAFAQSVLQWNWNPERIADLPVFWRNLVRIEMRCISRPSPRELSTPFRLQTVAWLASKSLDSADLAPLKAKYVAGNDPRLAREDLAAIPALLVRLQIETDSRRATAIAQHLDAALAKASAPAAARALALNERLDTSGNRRWSAERVRMSASHLAILEKTDPQSPATAWLALEYAISLEANGRFDDARPVLERVLGFAPEVLDVRDPLRDVATLHLAALARRSGDSAKANAKVAAAGITPAQCLLFDVRPVPTNTNVAESDFPTAALYWGFDGYVREAFDIDATGAVANVRTVIAYPPYVFPSAAEKTVARFRYLAPVVDGNSVGCSGHAINVNYRSNN